MEKITPKVDIAFKKIFGVEENKDLLISLINSIVSKDDQVVDLTLLNPYNQQSFRSDKLSIFDIKAIGIDGKKFNIEIQISDEADYDKRALYYWAKLYTEQLKASQDYGYLSKAIGIHILNFTSILETKKYHNIFHITEKEEGFLFFKDLELHTIELKKFDDNIGDKNNNKNNLKDKHSKNSHNLLNSPSSEKAIFISRIKTSLDMWVAFLTRHDLLNKGAISNSIGGKSLDKALCVIETMNFNEAEREAYEDNLKWLRIESNTLKKAEERGEEKALERTAINMLNEQLNEKLIAQVTGLSLEQIIILKAKL